ncbi:MAG: hypothetical protein N5P05_004495 (plasmid) [Chroococcopsis gigantea SAG 12.99]|jgi:hypothetical protein|nr:hypothetical protein [Chroococcopsis gigantea SAG 12.99]
MSDKLQQIQEVLGFNNGSGTAKTKNGEGSPEPTTFSATPPDVPLDDDLEEEFEQHFTYHSFASHPLSKLSIVALGAAGVVGFLVLFYSLVGNPMSNLHSSKSKPKDTGTSKETLFSGEPKKSEKDQLLAQLALSQQAQQMERHQSTQKSERIRKTGTSEVRKDKFARRNEPAPSKPSRGNDTSSRDLPARSAYNSTSYSPSRHYYRASSGREDFYQTPPRRIPAQIPLVGSTSGSHNPRSTKAQASEGDPQKRWQDLASLGSFKANTKDVKDPSSRGTIPPPSENDEGRAADTTPIVVDIPVQSVPVQKLKGRIEGGIAVPANRTTSPGDVTDNLEVSIVLDSAILDKDSRPVVPNGARLMAKVKTNGPMISFLPAKLAFEIDGQYREVELEPDAVAISGANGPLIAEVKTVGSDGGGLSANGLAQLATALGGMAGIDRATNLALVFNALGGNNARPSRNEGIRVYAVNDGTAVAVRLTRPLNLPLPAEGEKTPSELDLQ